MLFIIGREIYNGHPVYRVLNVDIHDSLMDIDNATVIVTDVFNIFNMIQSKNRYGEYNLLQNASIIMKNSTRHVKYFMKYDTKSKTFYFEGKNADTGETVRKSVAAFQNIRPEMLDLEGGVFGSLSTFRGYSSPDIVYTIIAEHFINGEHRGYCVVDQRCGGNIGYNVTSKAYIQIKQDVQFISDTRILYRKLVSNQRMIDIFTNAEVRELQGGVLVVSPKKKYSKDEDFVHVTGSVSNGSIPLNTPNYTHISSSTQSGIDTHYDVNEWRIVLLDGRTMRTGFVAGQDTLVFNKLKTMSVVELLIPEGVVDLSALNNMPYLKRLSIPSTLSGGTVQPGVCYNCKSLENVLLSKGVTAVSPDAFLFCPSLKTFSVSKENHVLKSVNGVLFSYDGIMLIRFPTQYSETTITIPKTVLTIAEGAFRDCKVTRVNIPRNVTLVAAGAFFGCTELIEVWVAATNLLEDCFCNCPNLRTLKILPGVKVIRGTLISDNHCIDKLIFPDTLENVIPLNYNARVPGSPLKEKIPGNHFLIGSNTSIAHICIPRGKPSLKYSANYFDGCGRVVLHDNSVETLLQAGEQNPQQYHVN